MLRLTKYIFITVSVFVGFPLTAMAGNVCFDCHKKDAFTNKVVHQPLVKGQCGSCHNPHVAHFKGLLDEEGADLCFSCHEQERKAFYEGTVHQPIRQGECLSCHEPHASSNRGLLKNQITGVCFSCHEGIPQKYKNSHAPFAKGQCFSCHRPHQSKYGQLLKDEPDNVCLSCHKRTTLQKGHVGFPAQLRDCLSCHNPHGSSRKALVRDILHEPYAKGCKECHGNNGNTVGTEKCLSCHAAISERMKDAHSHLTGKAENKCVACHSPHAADAKNLLKGSLKQVCTSCHKNTMDHYADTLYKHPGVDQCTDCHDVHGSNELVMLKGNGNTLCTLCHETQGEFTHPVGEKIRDPRTGQMVSCLSCHTPMGSDFKYQLTFSGSKDLCVQCHKKY